MCANNSINKRIKAVGFLFFLWVMCFHTLSVGWVSAQESGIQWSTAINISNTPDYTSTDPFLLPDPAGFVHLFWSEKVTTVPGEQPDTLMYSRWDGKEWTKPIDIFFAPPQEITLVIAYPQAVIDDEGRIHLIWLGEPNAPAYTLYYSSVNATQAVSAQAWQPRSTLAEGLTGTKYSAHIAFTSPQTIHVMYARVPSSFSVNEERTVTYIRSTDGGESWSDPIDIYKVPYLNRGASDVRLLADPPDRLYASWTEWDETGNGQAIFFARSLDNGLTWDSPILLAKRLDPEYERDWNGLALLGPNRIVSIWEGGYRAYRYAMYSEDGGETWSEPVDVFPYLIGDNGRVQFVTDSLNRLHVFVAQRIREGNEIRGQLFGLWHSIWDQDSQWTEPVLVTRDPEAANGMTNPVVAIVNGNQIVAAWYGSGIFEIMVQTGLIESAPRIPPAPWKSQSSQTFQSSNTPEPVVTPTNLPVPAGISDPSDRDVAPTPSVSTVIFLGVFPAFTIVASFIAIYYFKSRNKF